MATVELIELYKQFGDFVALEDLNLSINNGEFLVLLGPSGCGKSTTMRIIAGLEQPTSGDIIIGGTRINDIPARNRDLAMVFQDYALYPHMTVFENISYPLKIARVPKDVRLSLSRDAASKVELDQHMNRYPAELSGGQRQRVALARAIVRTPRLFLMDEPLSNLDAKLRTSMRGELKHLQKELATTTIYVTHDQVEAMTLADRIVILNNGKIMQIGTPADVYAKPANTFVAGFVGSPPMNLIEGVVSNSIFSYSGGQMNLASSDGISILGVRPEDIKVTDNNPNLSGIVFSSELLGDCTLLNVRVGENLIAAKIGPEGGMEMNSPVNLKLNPDKIHIFDAQSGMRRDNSNELSI